VGYATVFESFIKDRRVFQSFAVFYIKVCASCKRLLYSIQCATTPKSRSGVGTADIQLYSTNLVFGV
jgi:hypothetical protein